MTALYFLSVIVVGFVIFCFTSAYYRNLIRNNYIYVGDENIFEVDPRKKLPSEKKEKNSYREIITRQISDILRSRNKSVRKNI